MLNAYECESRNFCWAVHEIPGVPWCYWKEGEGLITDDMCAATSGKRAECAVPGKPINEKTCAAKGCCWRSGEAGQPWCYHPGPSGATPRPKKAAEPAKPAEPTPPLQTPRFIRPVRCCCCLLQLLCGGRRAPRPALCPRSHPTFSFRLVSLLPFAQTPPPLGWTPDQRSEL